MGIGSEGVAGLFSASLSKDTHTRGLVLRF